MTAWAYQITTSLLLLVAVYLVVRYGRDPLMDWMRRQERAYDVALRHRLLLDLEPRAALMLSLGAVAVAMALTYLLTLSFIAMAAMGAFVFFLPQMIIRHLELKRQQKLNEQLIDGLSTLASATRAGLNLVQAMDLLVQNHTGPIKQEFAQIMREYQMGLDLNQALHNASNRIGSSLYRLTFTAIEMHRVRGGDTGESLDRIADSIRDIQRLEGRLDALTAQGRSQAVMMAVMPLVFLAILYTIDAEGVTLLFTEPIGRMVLLGVVVLIVAGFFWIRRIMAIDI